MPLCSQPPVFPHYPLGDVMQVLDSSPRANENLETETGDPRVRGDERGGDLSPMLTKSTEAFDYAACGAPLTPWRPPCWKWRG